MAETLITDTGTVASSAGALVTVASSIAEEFLTASFTNNNTTTETLKLYLVPNSTGSLGTAAATNCILTKALAADETYIHNIGAPIMLSATNDSIQAVTTTASKVVYALTRIHHA